jgi:hypothetical protein
MTSRGWFVRYLKRLELACNPFAIMSGNEIFDASSLASEYLVHMSMIGQASKQLTSFRWRTKIIGRITATIAGLQVHWPVEGASIQYRMACYLILPYTSSLIAIASQSTRMYEYLLFQ